LVTHISYVIYLQIFWIQGILGFRPQSPGYI